MHPALPHHMKITGIKLFSIIISTIIVIIVIVALFLVGSPKQERLKRFDEQRLQNLQEIRFVAIDQFYQDNRRLPDALQEMYSTNQMSGITFLDPVSKESYGYTRINENTYELCTVFDMPSDSEMIKYDPFWEHGSGPTCFTISVQLRSEQNVRPSPAVPMKEY